MLDGLLLVCAICVLLKTLQVQSDHTVSSPGKRGGREAIERLLLMTLLSVTSLVSFPSVRATHVLVFVF